MHLGLNKGVGSELEKDEPSVFFVLLKLVVLKLKLVSGRRGEEKDQK